MLIKIPDTRFTLTGTLNSKGDEAYERLRPLGGKIVNFSGKTDVLIFEKGYSSKPEKAKAKGIVVINEAQLIELVDKGELEVKSVLDAPEGESSFEEMLGEVRGLIAAGRKAMVWTKLHELVDKCDPEQQQPLVDYIQGHLNQWSFEEQILCKAPHDWLLQLIDGQNSSKFQLVRALEMFDEPHSGTKIAKVLQNPDLTHLLSLNLNVHKYLTPTIFKKLHTLSSCANLVEFGLGVTTQKSFNALRDGAGLPKPKRFIWEMGKNYYMPYNDWKMEDFTGAVLSFSWLDEVESLKLDSGTLSQLNMWLKKNYTVFHKLKHLDLNAVKYYRPSPEEVESINALRLESVRINIDAYYNRKDWLTGLKTLPQVETLILELEAAPTHLPSQKPFERHFAALVVPSTTKTVVFQGEYDSTNEREALAKAYPELTIEVR